MKIKGVQGGTDGGERDSGYAHAQPLSRKKNTTAKQKEMFRLVLTQIRGIIDLRYHFILPWKSLNATDNTDTPCGKLI